MAPPMMRAHAANMYETGYTQVFSASKNEPEKWKNGHAFFRITSHDTNDGYIPYLLAIGFDANRTPIAVTRFSGVTIPVSDAEYWQAPLDEHVSPLTDAASTEQRIAIWGANRTGPKCVLVVNADGHADGVVPADDPDCDGLTTHECSQYVPNAVNTAATIESASCVLPVSAPLNSGQTTSAICVVGGPPCTDGQTSTGCDALDIDYCAPTKACASCQYQNWQDCAQLKLTAPHQTTGIPYAICAIAMEADGQECSDSSRRKAELDLGALLGSNATKCTSIRVDAATLPLGPFESKVTVNGATLELVSFQEPCKIEVQWSGDFMRSVTGAPLQLLDVALDNGKHMLLPFVVHGTDDGCSTGSLCRLPPIDSLETMLQCARPATDTTTCTTAMQCPDNAVACGARCCGRGESCVDGECRCGDGAHCVGDGRACVPLAANPTNTGCGDVCCGSGPNTPACPLP
jgi:hypothetical protein